MALPNNLVVAVEAHACFTGCYRHESPVHICVDTAAGLSLSFHVSCEDCFGFHVGALASALPAGMSEYKLAEALTAHVRALRGFRWAVSGYHAAGAGFWLSAAYYGDGLFLVDGARNRTSATDLDLLLDAFRRNVVTPDDPAMLDPAQYESEPLYVSFAKPVVGVRTKASLLASPQCSLTPKQGYRRVSAIEFLPLARAVQGAAPSEPPSGAVLQRLSLGDSCAICGGTVMERPLFSGTFVGCLC